ncbi:MAG: hypothetical protein ACE5HQ_01005 [Gemmatimonadota bacterium]
MSRSLGLLILCLSLPTPGLAQTVRVSVPQEAFRQTPNGKLLATVMRGATLSVLGRQGRWVHVSLEGWVWAPSVAATDRDGFDLVVSAVGGENLRATPNGTIWARLLQGFLLRRVSRRKRWIQVRRTGWIWAPSLREAPAPAPPAQPPPSRAGPGEAGPAAAARDSGAARPPLAGNRVLVGSSPTALRISPRGDTVAQVRPGTQVERVGRRGGWVRVRLEGWVPASELTEIDSTSVAENLDVEALRANPDRFRGRDVLWTVQFISLERAESVRTDFYEGEPFILARAPDPSQGFVYLAVPPALLPEVEALEPLESIRVLARVRTGRSALMGVPILDLRAVHEVG